jgi:hypothetical protein
MAGSVRSTRGAGAAAAAASIAAVLTTVVHADGDANAAEQRDLPPPREEQGPRTYAPPHLHGHPPLLDYGYYEPRFRVDQRARIAVRCLGPEGDPVNHVRFRLEVHNDTERDLEVLVDESFLQWARRARTPDRGRIRPRRGGGPKVIEPDETSHVSVVFPLRGRPDPQDLHALRFQWAVRSDLGMRSVHLSTFVREVRGGEARYAFRPDMDQVLDHRVYPWW